MIDRVIDFDNPREAAIFIDGIRRMKKRQRVQITAYRPRRSDRQNRYYWPCFVEPFADYLSKEAGELVEQEQAHEILKARFLKRQIIDKASGERFVHVASSAALDTGQFNEYLDKCAALLATLGIYVPEPDTYRERIEVPA